MVLSLSSIGCGQNRTREVAVDPMFNNLRNFTLAYMQATMALNHPPKNLEDVRPYLVKLGDVDATIRSANGEPLVIQWGVDIRNLRSSGGNWPIWVYEQSSRNGKRWTIQERNPTEMTDEQLKNGLFVPGLKKPV